MYIWEDTFYLDPEDLLEFIARMREAGFQPVFPMSDDPYFTSLIEELNRQIPPERMDERPAVPDVFAKAFEEERP